jgi:putative flippase GtrA
MALRRQLIRFVLVGLMSNLLCYVVYLGLTAYGMRPSTAMTLLFAVGTLQTFLFNQRWTFEDKGGQRTAFLRYCIAYGSGYLLNLGALHLMVDRLGFPHQIIQLLMMGLLAVMLFLLQKFWVFHTVEHVSTKP